MDSCGVRPFYYRCAESMQWQALPSTCNPPAPVCPASQPANGSQCVIGLVPAECRYPVQTPCGTIDNIAQCRDGRWQVSVISCNPPPPQPDAGPEAGADASADASDDGG